MTEEKPNGKSAGGGCLGAAFVVVGCGVVIAVIYNVCSRSSDPDLPEWWAWVGLLPALIGVGVAMYRTVTVSRRVRRIGLVLWLVVSLLAWAVFSREAAMYIGMGLGLQVSWLVLWARRSAILWGGRAGRLLFTVLGTLTFGVVNVVFYSGFVAVQLLVEYVDRDIDEPLFRWLTGREDAWMLVFIASLVWLVAMGLLRLWARRRARLRLYGDDDGTGWSQMVDADS